MAIFRWCGKFGWQQRPREVRLFVCETWKLVNWLRRSHESTALTWFLRIEIKGRCVSCHWSACDHWCRRDGRTATGGLRFRTFDVQFKQFHFAAIQRSQIGLHLVANNIMNSYHCKNCCFSYGTFRMIISLYQKSKQTKQKLKAFAFNRFTEA